MGYRVVDVIKDNLTLDNSRDGIGLSTLEWQSRTEHNPPSHNMVNVERFLCNVRSDAIGTQH
jgi:hypothetical protein